MLTSAFRETPSTVIADADVILVSIPLKKPSISGGGDDRRPSTATVVDLAGSALKTDQDVAYMKASARWLSCRKACVFPSSMVCKCFAGSSKKGT